MAFQFINDEQSQDRCEESLSGDVRQQVLTLMCCDVRDIAEICARARLAGTAPRRPGWTRAAASVHLLCVGGGSGSIRLNLNALSWCRSRRENTVTALKIETKTCKSAHQSSEFLICS